MMALGCLGLLLSKLYFTVFLWRKLGPGGFFEWKPLPAWIWGEYFLRDPGGPLLLGCVLLVLAGFLLEWCGRHRWARESEERVQRLLEQYASEGRRKPRAAAMRKPRRRRQ